MKKILILFSFLMITSCLFSGNFIEIVSNGTYEDVQKAISKGVDINQTDIYNFTPLFHAVGYNKNPEVTELLLKHGANPNARDVILNTPLMCAARNKASKEIVMLLLEYGADASLKNEEGKTALDLAIEKNNTIFIEYMDSQNAYNTAFKTSSGYTSGIKYLDIDYYDIMETLDGYFIMDYSVGQRGYDMYSGNHKQSILTIFGSKFQIQNTSLTIPITTSAEDNTYYFALLGIWLENIFPGSFLVEDLTRKINEMIVRRTEERNFSYKNHEININQVMGDGFSFFMIMIKPE
jgi:hypothetical protein